MKKKNSIVKAMNDQKEFSLWNTDPVKCSKNLIDNYLSIFA